MGDLALQQIAKALESVLRRPGDLIARYGGEEFVILLPETEPDGAIEVAERSLEKVNQLNIPHHHSEISRHISISIGLVTTPAADKTTPRIFLQTADGNLYSAKRNGRNQICASVLH
jgi:diguanylate cyclase (GGDEF)-like protein